MLDCLDYSKLLYECRKGVLRNNVDPPRLGVAEPHGYRDRAPLKSKIRIFEDSFKDFSEGSFKEGFKELFQELFYYVKNYSIILRIILGYP